ncbi:MAG: RHS repeat-associated core domain-containing protein [Clostridiales bacterium]|nr:RHS repeat-associated core domain-containing protein [Clostridiales bacterium]
MQGNVIAILDNAGKVVVKYSYNAWGNHTITAGADHLPLPNANPFRYRSYYYDTETSFYYLKTRYYDPEVGRFINIDSIEYVDPETINGLNLYAYCGNNPVMNTDSDGHFPQVLLGAAIGLFAGLFGQLVSDVLNGGKFSSWQTYVGAGVGGAVAGALATIGGPVASSVVGSLVADLTTYGLNLLTGQETRTSQEFLWETVENVALSAIFAYGGELISKGSSKVGPQLLKPIFKETRKTTMSVFLKEIMSESFIEGVDSILSYFWLKTKNILLG